jgi:hypothetical protein
MTRAGDLENVSAELTAARRQAERAHLEAEERVQAAEAGREQALAEVLRPARPPPTPPTGPIRPARKPARPAPSTVRS